MLAVLVSLASQISIASSGMVVSADPHATKVGVEILKAGGNAFDAAVAVGFALAVTYPQAGNIGGGGFMVAMDADGNFYAHDFRETAPAAASRDMFLNARGEADSNLSQRSHLAVGVPGTVEGLVRTQYRFGILPLREVMLPAIRLAREGFSVHERLASSLRSSDSLLRRFDATRASFYRGGSTITAGQTLKQPELARTLERISYGGRAAFYEGPVADAIVQEMKRGGGIITHEDLKSYRSQWRVPLVFERHGYTLVSMPPPSSGGVTLAQILAFVDPTELRTFGRNSTMYAQRLVEAQRLAFADRNEHLGDPDFVEVPLDRLLSQSYLNARKATMPKNSAGKSENVRAGRFEREETTHYCVADSKGNIVAVTYTLNGSYGMGAVVPGAGFLLNNEMDDFTSKPGSPNMFGLVQGEKNAIQPGKRMLSSMTPTIVLKDGKFAFTIGTPGGSTIITTVAQVFLNVTVFGMSLKDAVDSPRFHHQHLPDRIDHERDAFTDSALAELRKLGYTLQSRGSMGLVAAIQRLPDGRYLGCYDRRGYGTAEGY